MSRTRLAVLGVIAFGALIALSLVRPDSPTEIAFSDERAAVARLFEEDDVPAAYRLFKDENKDRPEQKQHLAAHLFGELLYEREDLDGFTVCDGEYGFGCFHGFLGRAIAEHGESVVPTLDAACVEAYGLQGLGCSHGLGHGLVSYFGYDVPELVEALTLCGSLTWREPYGGCRDGAFMEYNFRTMEQGPENRIRPFSFEARFEPCDMVPLESREACRFGLPAWWADALRSAPDRLNTEGVYCRELGVVGARRACFRGVGYAEVPIVHFKREPATAACDNYAGSERVWCREGVAWAFYADPALREHAETVCSTGLSADESRTCMDEYLFVLGDDV